MYANKSQIESLLMSERDAAKALSISGRMLAKQRKKGGIPYVRIGRRVLYSRAKLREWIANCEAHAT